MFGILLLVQGTSLMYQHVQGTSISTQHSVSRQDLVTNLNAYECPETEYNASRVSFRSVVGVEYFFEVYGSYGNTLTGDFTLEQSSFSEGPANEVVSVHP